MERRSNSVIIKELIFCASVAPTKWTRVLCSSETQRVPGMNLRCGDTFRHGVPTEPKKELFARTNEDKSFSDNLYYTYCLHGESCSNVSTHWVVRTMRMNANSWVAGFSLNYCNSP
jgi:hypothetical protein